MLDISNTLKCKRFVSEFCLKKDTKFSLLAAGEYNINHLFYSPRHEKTLVLRTSSKSQMGLKNQIEYEYNALKILEITNRTPKVYSYYQGIAGVYDDFLVMDFLQGVSLSYEKDLIVAANILADIHNLKVDDVKTLICPQNPVSAMYDESISMFSVYENSKYADKRVCDSIKTMFKKTKDYQMLEESERCIVNTELNSGNFLINKGNATSYLIDWEKPIIAFPAQDLGHFLAPSTTYWKTDSILKDDAIDAFLCEYFKVSNLYKSMAALKKATYAYISMNCLRGITWSAMAYVEYLNPDRPLKNEYTFSKIKTYLSAGFMDFIYRDYIKWLE